MSVSLPPLPCRLLRPGQGSLPLVLAVAVPQAAVGAGLLAGFWHAGIWHAGFWYFEWVAAGVAALASGVVLVSGVWIALWVSARREAGHGEAAAARPGREAALERLLAEQTTALERAEAGLAAERAARREAEQALSRARRLHAVGQLAAGLAHDFNNLLMAMLGNLDLLAHHVPDESGRRLAANAAAAAERGARLVAQLLTFSRRQDIGASAIDVNGLVDGLLDLMRGTFGSGVRIETALRPGLWPAHADATQVELIVLNLAINARDAMPGGGTITVGTENVTLGPPATPESPPAGDHVMVRVTDTGAGMPPEVRSRAFEPFFTTKPPGRGTGLGLSQVLGIARQFGGGVGIETAPGQGTTVRVYFPRTDEPPPAHAMSGNEAPNRLAGVKVLVVDDDAAVRAALRDLLEDLGAEVTEAESGEAALRALDADAPPQLAFIDDRLGGMTGSDLSGCLRDIVPDLAVFMMTGDAETLLAQGIAPGDVLAKPFRRAHLLERTARVLGPLSA